MTRPITLIAGGDVFPDRPEPRECFDYVRQTVQSADIGFCQLEGVLSERGVRMPQCAHTVRCPISTADAMKEAGFSVISVAGNHCMDWGPEGLEDTLVELKAAGLAAAGTGASLEAARRPAIVEAEGRRVAVLAYSSILPAGYWATERRGGCTPMRAFTVYEQREPDQPGTPANVHTYPHREDLAALEEDVRKAKEQADFVMVSLHWGIHFVPAVLADYQRDVARAAIDAGADAILGHHAHILKGVEIYKGKPVIYSLCNLATDLRMDAEHAARPGFKNLQKLNPNWDVDFDGLYNFPNDSRMSMFAKLTLGDNGVERFTLLPLWINRQAQPETLAASDERFEKVRQYLADISQEVGFSTRFITEGDEVVVLP